MNQDDWPEGIEKPILPDGYNWVCLLPAFVEGGKWWIQLKWTYSNGNQRMLKLNKEYFVSPREAIGYAVEAARQHAARRERAGE